MISLLVARNEFMRSLKDKKKLVLTFLLPLLSIIVAILVNNMMKPSINIGIIDNQYINKSVEEKMDDVDRVNVSKANKDTINTDMILAKYIGVVEFKEDNKFEVHCLDSNLKIVIEGLVNEIINTRSVNGTKALVSILDDESLTASQRGSGFIFITLIITCVMSASTMLKDKEERVILRYTTTPNHLSGYILGNYIYNVLSAIVQISLSAIIIYMIRMDIGLSMSQFILLGVVISILASSIATLITVTSSSELQSSLLASSIGLMMSLFGGVFLPVEKMPDMLKFVSNFSLSKWILELTSSMENGILYFNNLITIALIVGISGMMVYASTKIGSVKLKH